MPATDFAAPVPRVSLGDAVYDRLAKAILAGQFPCGYVFNEVELAQQFDVSRTPLREALRRLARDGLVTTARNRHPAVVQPSRADVAEAFQVRQLLEAGAAALAAERIQAPDLARLRTLAAEAQPGRSTDWCEAERRFDAELHQAVAEATGNARLHEEINRYLNLFRLVRQRAASDPARLTAGHGEHLAILDALEARDSRRAAAAMTDHIAAAKDAILALLP